LTFGQLGLGAGQTVLGLLEHRLPLGHLTQIRRLHGRLLLLQAQRRWDKASRVRSLLTR
jgi:hypothetical protein